MQNANESKASQSFSSYLWAVNKRKLLKLFNKCREICSLAASLIFIYFALNGGVALMSDSIEWVKSKDISLTNSEHKPYNSFVS